MTKLTGTGVCFLIGISLLSLGGCKKSPAPEGPERLYQVHHTAPVAPVNFIHKTFKVSTSTKFEFDVPPHALNPKLAGTFKAYSAGNPDEPAPLDLLLLTPEQFEEFSRGTGEPTYAVTGTSGQTVDYALQPTLDEPQKYILVFRNSAKNTLRTVEADFTASFE